MEAWHEPYRSERRQPAAGAEPAPVVAEAGLPAGAGARHDAPTRSARWSPRYGDVAAWAREAGYDGIQLGSVQRQAARPVPQPVLEPARPTSYGGSARNRARLLEEIRAAVAERAGADFTCTVKVPVAEKAPPLMPRTTWDEGIELARWCEEFGLRLGHAGRGLGVPRHDAHAAAASRRRCGATTGMKERFAKAAPEPARAHGDRGRLRRRRASGAVPAGVEPQPVRGGEAGRCRSRCSPSAASAPRAEVDAHPRRRPRRPRRHRPAVLRRARPAAPHPRRRPPTGARPGLCAELEPLRPRPDARA